jgi:hypothetical protein
MQFVWLIQSSPRPFETVFVSGHPVHGRRLLPLGQQHVGGLQARVRGLLRAQPRSTASDD